MRIGVMKAKTAVAIVLGGFLAAVAYAGQAVIESARAIPVAADVDVVVVGGTAEGVAAALAARQAGASVFLAGGSPYLGEDMAGTLELACDPSENATHLEKLLRASENGYAGYSYEQAPGFRYVGGWQYHNDAREKFSTSAPPHNPGDTVLYTNAAEVCCTLDAETEISRVEVLAVENADPDADASTSVDHRGALARGTRGPLTGRVTLTFLDGPRKGETVGLVREAKTFPVGGQAIRDGEPAAVRTPGADRASKPTGKLGVTYSIAVNGPVHRVRIDVAPAEGAACHLVSRIRFRRAATIRYAADPSPLKVKKTFDAELMRAGVMFLTGSPVTDVLEDGDGRLSGVVVANRSGRQAIRARAVVDTTMWRTLSHLGADAPGLKGSALFSRIVLAGVPPAGTGVSVETLPATFPISHLRFSRFTPGRSGQALTGRVYRCTFSIPVRDGSYASLAAAELEARARTWTPSTLDAADILQPLPMKPLGTRIREGESRGRAAAAAAQRRAAFPANDCSGLRVAVTAASGTIRGDVREPLGGLRPYDRFLSRSTVSQSTRELPVIGSYDTVVVGAGTAGVPAALGAARAGAKTLAVEYLHVMGGVGSEGMILGYYDGNHCGFTQEFKRSTRSIDADMGYYQTVETWRRFCRDAGVAVWFGTFGEGAFVENGQVKGVVVVTPFGRGVVRAKTVVDATGNSDIAAAAGAETVFLSAKEFALQSAGMAPHRLGRNTINSDFGFVNDPCAWDLWLFGVRARAGAPDSWDLAQLADSRERRRIVPDCVLEGWDIVARRKFPDTLVQALSRQDSHGYLQDDYCYVAETDDTPKRLANVPLRSFLPRGVSGIAVVGVGKGVARDAVPITRMKADLMNEGYALGLCAAAAARDGDGDFRKIDVKKVQRALVKTGGLPEEVLDWTTDPEVTDAELKAAADALGEGMHGTGLFMRCPERALPFLRAAYAKTQRPESKQALALVLGILGDATGAQCLADALEGRVKRFRLRRGVCYGGESMDRIGLPLALGRTKAPCAVKPLLGLLAQTDPVRAELRDVRAVTLALEALGSPAAAKPLADALASPGLGGWARTRPEELSPLGGYGLDNEMDRCLRELAYARALLACGDYEGRGRAVYESYARDPRGTLAEHANAVLAKYDALRDFHAPSVAADVSPDLARIADVRVFRGTERTAYRDPAVLYADGTFHLFFTYIDAKDGEVAATTCHAESRDLVSWTRPCPIVPRDPHLNYSSPGNVVRDGDDWVLCLQTYPRPGARLDDVPPKYGNADCRLFTLRSRDLRTWSAPELLCVKGPDVPRGKMGRMIDPYLIRGADGLWHCFFKQNGASFSTSPDLKTWTFAGRTEAGENVCVLPDDCGGWLMLHSPRNGMALKRSADLVHWRDVPGLITLGQKDWPWARGRITAGTVLDARNIAGVGKYLMFFHASGPKTEHEGDFDKNASIGLAWSDDLVSWSWPGKESAK